MRIAIVNDMVLAVEAVRRVITGTGGHELAWVATDGAEAVSRCASDRPDLVLMDLIMPGMDGVQATRQIMANSPCPVVVVTASVESNSSKVFEAMGAGALDAVNTPAATDAERQEGSLALLSKIETIRRLIGAPLASPGKSKSTSVHTENTGQHDCLVAIGASAGGPGALARMLSQIPASFPAPMVIIQHVDPQFAQGLADWLGREANLPVRLAQARDRPSPGTILLAASEEHLVLTSTGLLAYTSEPQDCPYRPSIDVFFKSIEQFWTGEVVGVLLTGMGRDGAEGLLGLREKQFHTIAQDEWTSAVYGMPKAAAELGAACEILPLEEIGPRLESLVIEKTKAHG
jgi:two-component system response regulator WspF